MSTVAQQLPLFDRVCTKCHTSKPANEYYVKDKRAGRRYAWCRVCHNRMGQERCRQDPAKRAAYARKSRAANPEAARAKDAEKYRRDADKIKARARERRLLPDVQAQQAAYRAARADKSRRTQSDTGRRTVRSCGKTLLCTTRSTMMSVSSGRSAASPKSRNTTLSLEPPTRAKTRTQ